MIPPPGGAVAAGALGVILLGLAAYAVVKLVAGPPSPAPGTTTAAPSTVSVSPSAESSAVTQTVTVPPRWGPFQPRP